MGCDTFELDLVLANKFFNQNFIPEKIKQLVLTMKELNLVLDIQHIFYWNGAVEA